MTQSSNIDEAEETMQEALDRLAIWADRWKMTVSTEKTECALFTTDPHQAKRQPKLTFKDEPVKFNATPTLLGVVLDRTLSFKHHINAIRKRMDKRLNVLAALRGTTWGCRKSHLRSLYTTYVRPVAEYGMAAWMPPTAASSKARIEVANNRGARIITGCTRTTPTDLLLDEADLMPLEERGKVLSCIALEKALRQPEDNPRSETAKANQRRRLKTQRSWREEGRPLCDALHLNEYPREALLPVPSFPPWNSIPNVTFRPNLDEEIRRIDDPAHKKRAANATISALPIADFDIYTDGAVGEGCRRGGAGCTITNRAGGNHTITNPAGYLCSSFKAEQIALCGALEWLQSQSNLCQGAEVRICTDSRSLIQSLQSGPAKRPDECSRRIWELLALLFQPNTAHLTLQWVPGHSDVEGNEAADALAKRGMNAPQRGTPIDFDSAKAAIKRHVWHRWKAGITNAFHKNKAQAQRRGDESQLGVEEQRILSQLRGGGHCTILQSSI